MDILKITVNNGLGINIFVPAVPTRLLIILLILLVIIFIINIKKIAKFFKGIEFSEIELGTGNNAKVTLKPNHQVKQIAYKLWVELSTRKLGIPIDVENDVIIEVHESWYKFFAIARELIKEIPAEKANNKDVKQVIDISTKILNEAIRTHLTLWQARFKYWYNIAKDKYPNTSPQEIQTKFECSDKSFDCYNEMIDSLIAVNTKLIHYKNLLEKIVFD